MKREDGSFLVDAMMAIQDAFAQLGIAKVPDDYSEYRTLAGFVLRRLGHIPTAGEQFDWDTNGDVRRFEVVDLDGHRIDKVIVSTVSTVGPGSAALDRSSSRREPVAEGLPRSGATMAASSD